MKLTTTIRKKFRVRNKLKKVAKEGRLRLCISRSTKNISAQIIDDSKSKTLISASSSEKDIKMAKKNKSDTSALVAEKLAKIAKEKISEILDEYLPLNERRHPANPECIKWINKLGLEKSSYYLHEFHNKNNEWYGKFAENTNLYLALSAIGENVIEQCNLDFNKCIKNMHENYLLAGKSEYIKDIDEFENFLQKKDNNYHHNLKELIKHRLIISSLIGFHDMKENLYFNYY